MTLRIGREPRAVSPITVGKGKKAEMPRNGNINTTQKINRIDLTRTAVVEKLEAESPSCVWVRLQNHITPELIITEPYNLKKIPRVEDLNQWDYCMAPYEDRSFARCRVLKKKEEDGGNVRLQVIFIDMGKIVWIDFKCAAVMPDDFYFHPWQAIFVCVADIARVRRGRKAEAISPWSSEDCAAFNEVLGQFDLLKTKTLIGSTYRNCAREPIMVELFGLRSLSDTEGVSISALFASKTYGGYLTRRVGDVSKVPIIRGNSEDTLDETPTLTYRMEWPDKWQEADVDDSPVAVSSAEWERWSPDTANIPQLTKEFFIENNYHEHTKEDGIMVCVEGTYTVSPYEWYARYMKRVDSRVGETEKLQFNNENLAIQTSLCDDTQTMLAADKELKDRSEELDSFYSIAANRCVIDKEKVVEWLREGKHVYAIAVAKDDRAQYTGEFQRVQIMEYQPGGNNTTCCIRFLDSGGRELEVSDALYKIHPVHCTYPPLCAQFCVQGICDRDPAQGMEWSTDSKMVWDRLLRVDVPVIVMFVEQLNKGAEREIGCKPWQEDHVLFTKFVKVSGEEGYLTRTMLEKLSSGSARANENAPIPWPN